MNTERIEGIQSEIEFSHMSVCAFEMQRNLKLQSDWPGFSR